MEIGVSTVISNHGLKLQQKPGSSLSFDFYNPPHFENLEEVSLLEKCEVLKNLILEITNSPNLQICCNKFKTKPVTGNRKSARDEEVS